MVCWIFKQEAKISSKTDLATINPQEVFSLGVLEIGLKSPIVDN